MANDEQPIAGEQKVLSLVRRLLADGDTEPLIALLQDGREGPERARNALIIIADLDPELIVQVALDALLRAHVADHHAAHQTRRVMRDNP